MARASVSWLPVQTCLILIHSPASFAWFPVQTLWLILIDSPASLAMLYAVRHRSRSHDGFCRRRMPAPPPLKPRVPPTRTSRRGHCRDPCRQRAPHRQPPRTRGIELRSGVKLHSDELHSSKQQGDIALALKAHVVSSCFKCFICLRGMLQVFRMDVAKIDRDVAYVAMVIHICCKRMFLMFHLLYCKCVYLDVAYVLYICCKRFIWMLRMCCNCFSSVFSCVFVSVSDACFKYFICLQTYVANVVSVCFKSRSGVASPSLLSVASPWCLLITFCCLAYLSSYTTEVAQWGSAKRVHWGPADGMRRGIVARTRALALPFRYAGR
jgi:hypothetical protein